jgi:hypothetical protein
MMQGIGRYVSKQRTPSTRGKSFEMRYRVEVHHWTRSWDGDDWIDSAFWKDFGSLEEAVGYAENPDMAMKHLMYVKIYDDKHKLLREFDYFYRKT